MIEGKVSLAAARDDYGVVLKADEGNFAIDEEATAAVREELRRARQASRR